MPFNNDLTKIVGIFGRKQYAQINGDELVEQSLAALLDAVLAHVEENGAFQHDIAGVSVYGGFQIGAGKRVAQLPDDLRSHAYQIIQLFLLGAHGFLLLSQQDRGVGQLVLLGLQIGLGDGKFVFFL